MRGGLTVRGGADYEGEGLAVRGGANHSSVHAHVHIVVSKRALVGICSFNATDIWPHRSPNEGLLYLFEVLHWTPALRDEAPLGHVQVEHVHDVEH